MLNGGIEQEAERLWNQARDNQDGLSLQDFAALDAALEAVDGAWDDNVFGQPGNFDGTDIATARALTSNVLRRLLEVEYAGIASVVSDALPPSNSQSTDVALRQARADAINTYSGELLSPEMVGSRYLSAQPIILPNATLPIGAALIISRKELTHEQVMLMNKYLVHADTRLVMAEELLKLRKKNDELTSLLPNEEVRTFPQAKKYSSDSTLALEIAPGHTLDLFSVPLPSEHYTHFIGNLTTLTANVLNGFKNAEHLYLNHKSGIDAKDGSKDAKPYFRLLQTMDALRGTNRALAMILTTDVDGLVERGLPLNYSSLTRIAQEYTDDSCEKTVLRIMNDVGEDKELSETDARDHPYEFRIANMGEALSIIALHQTIKDTVPKEERGPALETLDRALSAYPTADAFLLACGTFEDKPLKGQPAYEIPHVAKTLLMRQAIPGIATFAYALSEQRKS